ncbi:hypothetical protein DRN43_00445 [Thermococci archaeon]|nr:MAG: hypothetical protein DRN39_05010 [Thermococci archaeon]RLF91027.1 MAG: hypothetical protein DRN43_00445 [Thermococci archaeon]
MRIMDVRKLLSSLLLLLVIFSMGNFVNASPKSQGVKNIVILIGDDMDFGQVELTRLVHDHLNMEEFPVTGFEGTYSLSGEVTDSAAAEMAITAVGNKNYTDCMLAWYLTFVEPAGGNQSL